MTRHTRAPVHGGRHGAVPTGTESAGGTGRWSGAPTGGGEQSPHSSLTFRPPPAPGWRNVCAPMLLAVWSRRLPEHALDTALMERSGPAAALGMRGPRRHRDFSRTRVKVQAACPAGAGSSVSQPGLGTGCHSSRSHQIAGIFNSQISLRGGGGAL